MEAQLLLAKSRIQWAGWRMLEYIDADEEAAFMATDFKSSRDVTLVKDERLSNSAHRPHSMHNGD